MHSAIQRMVLWDDTTLMRERNTAQVITAFHTYADTYAKLNDVEYPGNNLLAAVDGPDLDVQDIEDGVRLRVHSDATNEVAARVELPSPPPWVVPNYPSNNLAVRLGVMEQQNVPQNDEQPRGMQPGQTDGILPNPPRPVDVRAFGHPNDAAFARKVEEHELHHVDDVYSIFRNRLVPWDVNITNFRQQGESIEAGDEPTATAQFYQQMGGTPAQIGQGIRAALVQAGQTFHATHEGGMPRYDDINTTTILGGTTTVNVVLRHPTD